MAIVHRIAPPENASETRAVTELAKHLSDAFTIFHNFELATQYGMPYEYDLCVVSPYAVYHVEVKGYRGQIRGDVHQWLFENGGVAPSPIPLANKKTKILAGKLRGRDPRMDDVFVETMVLLTDDRADAKLNDDQAERVVRLPEAIDQIKAPRGRLGNRNIAPLHDRICRALFQTSPRKRVAPDGAADSRAALDTEHVAKAIEAAGPSGFDKSPEDVASVIARMCHPEPGERYQRMEEVKDDLAIIGQ